jgi:LuxR family maltose regulon positive regulatory protein
VVAALLRAGRPGCARAVLQRARTVYPEAVETAVARALAECASGHHDDVLSIVEPVAAKCDSPDVRVTADLLRAAARRALGHPIRARAAVVDAVRHAAPQRLLRPFLDVPAARELLDLHAGSFGPHNDFADQVRRHPALPRAHAPVLTQAELTVLGELPSGRTAAQIARQLGVSVNTVKTHLRSVYSKLGTSSRAETIASAHRLGAL